MTHRVPSSFQYDSIGHGGIYPAIHGPLSDVFNPMYWNSGSIGPHISAVDWHRYWPQSYMILLHEAELRFVLTQYASEYIHDGGPAHGGLNPAAKHESRIF